MSGDLELVHKNAYDVVDGNVKIIENIGGWDFK